MVSTGKLSIYLNQKPHPLKWKIVFTIRSGRIIIKIMKNHFSEEGKLMKKSSFFIVLLFFGAIGFLFFNQLHGILTAGQQHPLPKLPKIYSFKNLLDVRRFLQQPPAYPEKDIFVSGIGSGNSDLATKNVWATAMNDNLEARDYAEIGFWSIALENASSMPWT